MFCRASDEMMSARLDGMLAPDDVRRLEEHLSSCAKCRAQYILMRDADSLLRSSARRPVAPPSDFASKVMSRVAATPVQRPSLWDRERAQVEGGRRTVRLNPTGPITGRLVAQPITGALMAPPTQPTGQTGILQGLNDLRNRWTRLYIGGLSAAGVLSVLLLSVLVWMWSSGAVNAPGPLNALAGNVERESLVVSVTSLWRLAEGMVLSINPWLVALGTGIAAVLGALWWSTILWFVRHRDEVRA